ncbi:TPA: hypothetical protein ACHKDG_003510, partial [Escherichia coli]
KLLINGIKSRGYMEIKDVFGAQPKSVWEYICENGQGLYVPAYQRQYSWDKPPGCDASSTIRSLNSFE